jgi:hypothetical protein
MPEQPTPEPAREAIQPLKDVWLRPRRVFRELAARPIGIADYLLASAQGIGNCFVLYRTEAFQSHASVGEILGNSLLIGPIAGVASMFLFATIYARLGLRGGGKSTRDQVFHVLAYGGIPVVVALGIWALTALLVGDAAFVDTPTAQVDGFLLVILRLQFAAYMFLSLWSLVLQVMGFSEIQGFTVRKSFGIWLLGQALWFLALVVLLVLIAVLFPSVLPMPST